MLIYVWCSFLSIEPHKLWLTHTQGIQLTAIPTGVNGLSKFRTLSLSHITTHIV